MEDNIKQIRIKLDGLTQLTESLDPQNAGHPTRTREISLTITSLQLSKMWLGKVLKELGIANPYPESKNPSNEKIESTTDTIRDLTGDNFYGFSNIRSDEYIEFTHIQKVKWLRGEIEKIENELKALYIQVCSLDGRTTIWLHEHVIKSNEYCMEAGMWLGMELGRIRDEENKQINK